MLTFRVSEITSQRIKKLREATKYDDETFIDMLDRWVEELANQYGIEQSNEQEAESSAPDVCV